MIRLVNSKATALTIKLRLFSYEEMSVNMGFYLHYMRHVFFQQSPGGKREVVWVAEKAFI